jgi:uncharacterized membrane protein
MTTTDPADRTVATPVDADASPASMDDAAATRMFSRSVVVSGVRCLLAYIVLPWLVPLWGALRGIGPVLGLVVGVVAIGFNVASIRRFQRSGHRWRWWITALNSSVIVLLVVLVARDIADLLG